MSLILGLDSELHFFDSHARSMPYSDGSAIVMKFIDIVELHTFLCSLSTDLNSTCFEVVPVKISQTCSKDKNTQNCTIFNTELATNSIQSCKNTCRNM